jgi:hypothetical protein
MSDRYKAFISYAWRDNQPFSDGGKGWVSTFVDRLCKHLDRELPRAVAKDPIWLDYEQMRGNHNIADHIRTKLEASRLLVPIISKSYLDSPWCRQELEIFLDRHGAAAGRIFPVWMEPVESLPAELDDLLKYQFWYEDDKKQPRIRWFPDIDPSDREYGRVQQDMARDMAAGLKNILAEEQDVPRAEPEPAPPQPVRPGGEHTVLVNGGEEDADLICEVADCLFTNHGIGSIVPLSALPDQHKLKSSDITRDLRDKLKVCTAVLIVYRNGPKHQIHSHITQYMKIMPQRPKSRPAATLDLCRPADESDPLGVQLPQMQVHSCDPDCAADCARRIAARLA